VTAQADEPAERWEGETTDELALLWGVPAVHAYRRIGSTSDVARRLAEGGAPAGTTVVADEQLSGRGRVGRSWSSPAGLGVWVSLVSRPPSLPRPGLLPLLVGLEVARALDAFAGPGAVRLKWPNDVLLGGRKLGGILCEATWAEGAPAFVVIGVGVNVQHRVDDFPEEIREVATSLRIAGASASLLEVASRLVPALRALTANEADLAPAALADLGARDALRGRRVTVTDPATGALLGRGTAAGIAPDGALLLRDEDGTLRPLRSGTVRDSNDDPDDE
jgi:BirA family transcriptional regulator, biotin operon repressor / biotin---[acetyl-CoA-carboxylase] ligase